MSVTFENEKPYDETIPVLIVGGSLIGLSTALFLAWRGVPTMLVERHAGISPFVRAGGFNPRTMEIYRSVGIEPAIRQAEPEGLQNFMILRVESLAGKELGSYTQSVKDLETPVSPVPGCLITQNLLEPILRAEAERLGGDLRFNTQLVSSAQDAEGVSAVIRNLLSGEERTVRARYLVAADGNDSPLRSQLGIKVHGPGTLSNQMFMLFNADLRHALRGRPVLFCYVSNPEVPQGVIGAGPDGLSGILSFSYYPEKGESEADFAGARGVELVRKAAGEPDLAVEIVSLRTWEMAAFVAERFQNGRIFFAGDSAHVMPPTGGFGANTGIADAQNLAWKLALVLKGQAGPQLLESYEAERRPAGQFTVDQAFGNFIERMAPQRAAQGDKPKVDHYTVVFGYRYLSAAIISSAQENTVQEEFTYEDPNAPSGRPGFRAPHIVLERDGKRLSTLDLFGRNFVLLTGSDGLVWRDAAHKAVQALGLELDVYRIGEAGDFVDEGGTLLTSYGISSSGATLVRPDGFVAWRTSEQGEHPAQTLKQALEQVLGWKD